MWGKKKIKINAVTAIRILAKEANNDFPKLFPQQKNLHALGEGKDEK